MKRAAAYLLVLLLAAAAGYGITYHLRTRRSEDQWVWLRREFHLSNGQFARVQALHDAYQPVCADHCSRILAARQRLEELSRGGQAGTADYRATLARWEDIRRECEQATLRHLDTVAAAMNPADGRRYLAMMVPRVLHSDHSGPPGIR